MSTMTISIRLAVCSMQDHTDALNQPLSANGQCSSLQRRHVHNSGKHANKEDANRRGVHEQSKRARSTSPMGPGRGVDLFDSDVE